MQNDQGLNVDLYIPRKWCVKAALLQTCRVACCCAHAVPPACSSWTKRLITAKDHAAVQINVGNVDPATGVYTREYQTFALSGFVRQKVRLGNGVPMLAAVVKLVPHTLRWNQGEADMALMHLLSQSE